MKNILFLLPLIVLVPIFLVLFILHLIILAPKEVLNNEIKRLIDHVIQNANKND